MTPQIDREPAITAASLTALVTAVLALVVSFGVPLDDQQQAAILGVVAVVGPLVVGFLVRPRVTPNGDVVERADGSDVVAGEANELPTGTVVRTDLGDYEPQHAED